MKNGFLYLLKSKPIYAYLLCVFFVFHGFVENFDFVPLTDALLLTVTYFLATLVVVLACWVLYRDFANASLLAFLILSFHFFFGGMHDFLKRHFPTMFIS